MAAKVAPTFGEASIRPDIAPRVAAIGLIVVAFLASLAPALADKRVALVVGNAAYRNIPRLDNPANDAKLMAETLRGLGFTLVGGKAQLDLDKAGFDNAVQNFSNNVQGADVALFYYAGHGVQVRGANYLVPVAANPVREANVFLQMVDIALVLSQMEGSGTKLNLVILDACRNNPFGGRGLRSSDGGLAQMRAPEGTLISFATQPGNVALDGRDGNSPYTKALAATLRKPGLGIFDAFNEVGLTVKGATGNAQQPWLSSSPIAGSFYFTPPVAALATAPSGPSADEIAWDFVKDSQDAAQLRRFIEQYPLSSRRGEALSRLGALAQKVAARPASEPNVPAGSRRLVVNFDGIDARGRDTGVAENILSDYLARFGVTLTPQGSTRVAVFDDRDVLWRRRRQGSVGIERFLAAGRAASQLHAQLCNAAEGDQLAARQARRRAERHHPSNLESGCPGRDWQDSGDGRRRGASQHVRHRCKDVGAIGSGNQETGDYRRSSGICGVLQCRLREFRADHRVDGSLFPSRLLDFAHDLVRKPRTLSGSCTTILRRPP